MCHFRLMVHWKSHGFLSYSHQDSLSCALLVHLMWMKLVFRMSWVDYRSDSSEVLLISHYHSRTAYQHSLSSAPSSNPNSIWGRSCVESRSRTITSWYSFSKQGLSTRRLFSSWNAGISLCRTGAPLQRVISYWLWGTWSSWTTPPSYYSSRAKGSQWWRHGRFACRRARRSDAVWTSTVQPWVSPRFSDQHWWRCAQCSQS